MIDFLIPIFITCRQRGVYMALRCFLGKMRIANKFLHSKERIMMLGTSEVFKHKNKELLSIAFPTLSSPRHFRDTENRAPTPIATKKEVRMYLFVYIKLLWVVLYTHPILLFTHPINDESQSWSIFKRVFCK